MEDFFSEGNLRSELSDFISSVLFIYFLNVYSGNSMVHLPVEIEFQNPKVDGESTSKARRKRSTYSQGEPEVLVDSIDEEEEEEREEEGEEDGIPSKKKRQYVYPLKLEIALFLDAVVLKKLYSFYTEDQGINLILSLMNNVSYDSYHSLHTHQINLYIDCRNNTISHTSHK